jgi:hypothetical protein
MRRYFPLFLVLASCGSDQSLDYDLDPIPLARAPISPGGPLTGGLLAQVDTAQGRQPLLVDTGFPLNSFVPDGCVGGGQPGWTYLGTMNVRDGSPAGALRASFRNVGLFDVCPGSTGDATTQPAGVLGGSLLANFSVGLTFPRDLTQSASLRLWPGFPGSDDQLGQDGWVALRFDLQGSAAAAQGNGETSLSLPNSRIVLAACAAPRAFTTAESQESCANGESALKASGQNLLLAVGTGEGPLILSQSAWARIAKSLGLAADSGTSGELYTPYQPASSAATPARFLSLPRLAIFQGTTDNAWLGACAELARARRIEWVLANQALPDTTACFQPCDTSSGNVFSTRPYLELGGDLLTAVIAETSEIIRSLNVGVPPHPQVDGIIGAGTLMGTRLQLDYPSKPQGRMIAACEDATTRDACWTSPSCLPSPGQIRTCFGQTARVVAKTCP